ncbi:nucleotidyltransferase family protein [uncultured Phocaeicola sp.]|uniref:nucleotidyltransferase family protein n=1 Tax=uncultured Phocaeicola sp. TaxID=990718 RepID=UPI0025CDD162|nr:nucleotidyltransferase domain-containing protein [uncultured Phocaeicola sp.]
MERPDVRVINLKDLIRPLTQIDTIKEIYIFGSRAYNTGSLRSDIDILVYAPDGVTQYEIAQIIKKEKALDIFETTNKIEARSFANDSRLRRDDLVKTLDALLLWEREDGFKEEALCHFQTINILRDYNFKMSCMPSCSKSEEEFFKTFGYSAVFVIMPFIDTLDSIYQTIEKTLKEHKMIAVRADIKEFSDDLWGNVSTYLNCCVAAIAVFNKFNSEEDIYNPNVALENRIHDGFRSQSLFIKRQLFEKASHGYHFKII